MGYSQLSRLDHFDKIEKCKIKHHPPIQSKQNHVTSAFMPSQKAYSPQQLSLHIHVKISYKHN